MDFICFEVSLGYFTSFTSFTSLTLESEGDALTRLSFGNLYKESTHSKSGMVERETAVLSEGKKQISAYLSGELLEFSLPISLKGSEFQQKVWFSLLKIPYGSTCSYEDLGKLVGCEQGFRAVGNANGKNPLPLILPCHRVIRKNGDLGGYSGGVAVKKALLEIEKRI